jgi:predicted nucleotide-binding protein
MPPQLLRDALDVVLTWGPERMTPELVRLKEKQPWASEEERQEALQSAYQVLSAAEAIAPEVKRGATNANAQLRESFPWASDEQIARAIQQGLYSHWRDTGL